MIALNACPRIAVSDSVHLRDRDSEPSSKIFMVNGSRAKQIAKLNHLSACQLGQGVALTSAVSAMSYPVRLVSLGRVPRQVAQTIVGWSAIIVECFHPI